MGAHPTHVQQGYNEVAKGVAIDNPDLLLTGRKRLAAAGVDPDEAERAARAELAAASRKAAVLESPAGQRTPPAGRRAPTPETTTATTAQAT